MRLPGATAAIVAVAFALAACSAQPAPAPDPTRSRDIASASRCLADHSPWTVDLDGAYQEWADAVDAERPVRGGTVSGSAELSFTRDAEWTFVARRVEFGLTFTDGSSESTSLARELTGTYELEEPDGSLELTSTRVAAAATDAATIAADGTRHEGASVAPPLFPWDAPAGTTLAFACSEHRLLVSTPGETPTAWRLLPG